MQRSEGELLEVVYRRSAEIRRRRLTARVTLGTAAAVLVAVILIPRVADGSGDHPQVAHGPASPRTTELSPANGSGTQPGLTTPACTIPEHGSGSGPSSSTTNPQPPPPTSSPPNASGEIAFSSDRSGDWEIYTMNLDGTDLRQVTNSPGIDREPDWSPDGTQIVFVKLQAQQNFNNDLYIVNADGTGLRLLASPGEAPTWSPDGNRIAYYTTGPDPMTGTVISQLWVINVDGSDKHLIGKELGDAAWMPDGHSLVVGGQSVSNPITNVYVLRDDGTGLVGLTDDPVYACSPAPSPDGKRVAFVNSAGASFLHLSLMNIDGTDQHPLTNGTIADATPSWSPDGQRIVFARDPDGDAHWSQPLPGGAAPSSIWTISPDGNDLAQITSNTWNDADPAFRPAGNG